jgi:hypothetical protein
MIGLAVANQDTTIFIVDAKNSIFFYSDKNFL